ncbi:hypothetical protein WH47_09859 [Habropoda laboriosa]|uniref:Uncharacterized protein n=1 Tax=Habropoda laboriosa TaxID=597456 RepID=A0A0L7R321_9HYME|nr:hypothetical protein WH47_09859 [Habropoda laboriosa]
MGSEADAESTAANAVDSDGSVSWEEFFGKSYPVLEIQKNFIAEWEAQNGLEFAILKSVSTMLEIGGVSN